MTFEELLAKLNGLGYDSKETYEDILWEAGIEYDDYVHDEIYDQRRWVTVFLYVYEYQGRYIRILVERGSTEYQEGSYDVDAREVQKVKKTVYDYIPIPKILPVPLDAPPVPLAE